MSSFARYLNIRSATMPVFSVDGNHVMFLSDITGDFQVWRVGVDDKPRTQWPQQLSFLTDKVWELHGTPKADHLIAVSDVGGNERQQFYLIAIMGESDDGAVVHDVRRLTQDSDAIHTFGAWNSDGRQIVYTSNARNGVDFDIFRMDVASGECQSLRECVGRRVVVAWALGDRYVLSVDAVATEQVELYLLDLQSGTERHLTAGAPPAQYDQVRWHGEPVYLISDRSHDRGAICQLDIENGALSEVANADDFDVMIGRGKSVLELLALAPNGRTAAVTANCEGYSYLFLMDLESVKLEPATLPRGVISNMRFGVDSSQLVFDQQTPQHPSDIWSISVHDHTVRRLTYSDRAGISARTFVAPDLIHYETFDGMQVPAFVYLPQRPPPRGGYPCILYVHGGPASQQRPDFDVRFQYFLREGYALVVPNVRGSTGYGREYMMLDDVERRMDSVADLKHAVEWIQGCGKLAADRIAIYGRSYGGFMVLAALTEYPHLFAAGIDVVGIADWVTFLERTSPWRRAHREREYGSLSSHREFLRSISPLHKAERISMPLLVLAGDNDPRVPLYESEQIVQRVRSANGNVQFIHYADEGHKFSKLANRIDSFTQMARFLKLAMGAVAD